MDKHLTGEQIRAVVAEIDTWIARGMPSDEIEAGVWRVVAVEHLHSLADEVYRVTYFDRFQTLFQRDTSGSLIAVYTWTYEATDNFEDMHKSAPESQVQS